MALEIRLSKPLMSGDKKLSTTVEIAPAVPADGDEPGKPAVQAEVLNLDFDALTGKDFAFCEREAVTENCNVPALDPRLCPAFQAHFASRACGVPVGILRKLGARDYGEVVTAVRDFFLVTD